MIVAPVAGLLAGRIGSRPVVVTGLSLQAAALMWIAAIAGWHTPYNDLLLPFVLGGVGMGLTFAPLSEAVMGSVTGNRQGQASGAFNSIRELGGVFGVAVLGAVFQHVAATPAQFLDGFRAALVGGASIVVIGVLASFLLPAVEHRRSEVEKVGRLALSESR